MYVSSTISSLAQTGKSNLCSSAKTGQVVYQRPNFMRYYKNNFFVQGDPALPYTGPNFFRSYFTDYSLFDLRLQFVARGDSEWFPSSLIPRAGHHSTDSVKNAWDFCHERPQVRFLLRLGRLEWGLDCVGHHIIY